MGDAFHHRGYVLWRGVLEESKLDDSGPLEGALNRLSYPEGHAVVYLVPGADASIEKSRRWVNWACYVRVSPEELPRFLSDPSGRQRAGSLPPGSMRFEEESRLTQLARENFPPYFAEIIEASQNTFVQAIYTAVVTHYRQGRYCLAGDAGARLVYSRFRAHGRAGDADWVAGRCENARRPVPIERQVNGRGSILSAGSTRC